MSNTNNTNNLLEVLTTNLLEVLTPQQEEVEEVADTWEEVAEELCQDPAFKAYWDTL